MARIIQNFPNVTTPDSDYPYGRIKDAVPGVSAGTPVNEFVYGDIHQFFARLMAISGVSANGNPENTVAGFQFIEALVNATVGTWEDASGLLVNGWSVVPGSRFEVRTNIGALLDPRFCDFELRGKIENANVSSNLIIANFPSPLRPVEDTIRMAVSTVTGPLWSQVFLNLLANGEFQVNSAAGFLPLDNAPIIVDGLRFTAFAAP